MSETKIAEALADFHALFDQVEAEALFEVEADCRMHATPEGETQAILGDARKRLAAMRADKMARFQTRIVARAYGLDPEAAENERFGDGRKQ